MNAIVNFHGIGEISREYEDGEGPYWISTDSFCQYLDMIAPYAADVDITFDDGNVSDYEIALPELQKRGLSATFFVLAGKIGQTGYLNAPQVEEISIAKAMEVGSHGMDHVVWPLLQKPELERELVRSKEILENIVGTPVDLAGLPFGRYDRRVLDALRDAGYRRVFSSDGGPKITASNPVPRFSVRADTPPEEMRNLIASNATLSRLKSELRSFIKARR